MPSKRPKICKLTRGGCGRHESEVGLISWRGLCLPCARRKQRVALAEIAAHNGPAFDHWRAQMAASVGGTILDAAARKP